MTDQCSVESWDLTALDGAEYVKLTRPHLQAFWASWSPRTREVYVTILETQKAKSPALAQFDPELAASKAAYWAVRFDPFL